MSWMVTAKHVFADPVDGWRPSTLGRVFPDSHRRSLAQIIDLPLRLTQAGRRSWFPHPNRAVDLACLPLPLHPRESTSGRPSSIAWMDIATTADLYEGAPVVVLGCPAAFDLLDSPRAIVRQGIVSWVSPTHPGSDVFLIDSHVFPGHSGGPVFRLPDNMDRTGRRGDEGGIRLLGIVTQARIQSLPLLAGGKQVDLYVEGKKASEPLLTPNFLARGLVEPAFRIKQLLVSATNRYRRRRASAP